MFFFPFGNTRVWTQGFKFARQHYHLNHNSNPFLFWLL
jgi:hypothetical protein